MSTFKYFFLFKYYGIKRTFTAGMPADQPFHVASIGKSFTAVLIAVLIEERKLSLDQKIDELLDKEQLSGVGYFFTSEHRKIT